MTCPDSGQIPVHGYTRPRPIPSGGVVPSTWGVCGTCKRHVPLSDVRPELPDHPAGPAPGDRAWGGDPARGEWVAHPAPVIRVNRKSVTLSLHDGDTLVRIPKDRVKGIVPSDEYE